MLSSMLPFPKNHYPIYLERDLILARNPYYTTKCVCIGCGTSNKLYALFPRAFAWGVIFPPAWGWIGARSIYVLFLGSNCSPTAQYADPSASKIFQNVSIQLRSRIAVEVSRDHHEVREQAKRWLRYSISALFCYGIVAACLFVTISAMINLPEMHSMYTYT